MSAERPLRVLSLDGGGVRGVASLYVLQEIMTKVSEELCLKPEETKLIRPCEYFDLICGTGTGGLIAVLLGRLRYTVDDAIDTYLALTKDAFNTSTISNESVDSAAAFNHHVLEGCIKMATMKAATSVPDISDMNAKFEDPSLHICNTFVPKSGCRTFVVATADKGEPRLLRSYGTPSEDPFEGYIWEAALATTVTAPFFTTIKTKWAEYGDVDINLNNPTRQAITEAQNLWPDCEIGCFISLGTGKENPYQLLRREKIPTNGIVYTQNSEGFRKKFRFEVAKYCARSITSCVKVHNETLANIARDRLQDTYLRFDTPGFEEIGLEEWAVTPDVFSLVSAYMNTPSTRKSINTASRLVKSLSDDFTSYNRDVGANRVFSGGILYIRAPANAGHERDSAVGISDKEHSPPKSECPDTELPEKRTNRISCTKPVASLLDTVKAFERASIRYQSINPLNPRLRRIMPRILARNTNFVQASANFLTLATGSMQYPDFSLRTLPNPDTEIPITKHLNTDQRLGVYFFNQNCRRQLLVFEEAIEKTESIAKSNPIEDTNASETLVNSIVQVIEDILDQLDKEMAKLTSLGESIGRNLITSQSLDITTEEEEQLVSMPPFEQIQMKLNHYGRVRWASQTVYSALARSCKDHLKHSAYFRLQPHFLMSDGSESYMEFKFRFSEYKTRVQSTRISGNVSWLAIQTRRSEIPFSSMSPSHSEKAGSFKRRRLCNDNVPSCLSSSERCDSGNCAHGNTGSQGALSSAGNLSSRKIFCKLIQLHDQQTAENPNLNLGYIETDGLQKYAVLFDDAHLVFGNNEPISLPSLMIDLLGRVGAGSMPYERVELAKQLASALLQFQHTPLLCPAWGSEDIVFFGNPRDRIEAHKLFKGPHLHVCIKETQGVGIHRSGTDDQPCTTRRECFIAHQWTFALAVILIEIAYQKPIKLLTDVIDCDKNEPADERQWLAADALCDNLASKLGTRYKAIVRKCLRQCLSGSEDVEKEQHDTYVYVHVINELEQLKVWMINHGEY